MLILFCPSLYTLVSESRNFWGHFRSSMIKIQEAMSAFPFNPLLNLALFQTVQWHITSLGALLQICQCSSSILYGCVE